MIFALIILVSALAISAVAAYFSIIGLTLIFSGAPMQIAFMGITLEIGKLVTASFLYRNWNKLNHVIKVYFTISVVVLSIITSLGIFGYLSKSYISDSKNIYTTEIQINTKEQQLQIEKSRLENLLKQQDQRATAVRRLEMELQTTQNNIIQLTNEIGTLKSNMSELSVEIGPIRYIAKMIYGSDDLDTIDQAVRLIILSLMFVFDPLAILLVVAANMQLKTFTRARKSYRIKNGINIDKSSVMEMKGNLFDGKTKTTRKKKTT